MIDKRLKPCEGKKDVEDNFNTVVDVIEGQKEYDVEIIGGSGPQFSSVINGTVTYGATADDEAVTYDAVSAIYKKPLVLPMGEDDKWILTVDFHTTKTNTIGGLPLANPTAPMDLAYLNYNDNIGGEYLPTRTYKGTFKNFAFSRSNLVSANMFATHKVAQLKYENRKIYSRWGQASSNYDEATNQTEGKVNWLFDWKEFDRINIGGNVNQIFTASTDEEKRQIQQNFKDMIRYLCQGKNLVFTGFGATLMTGYRMTGTIKSIRAKIWTKGTWNGEPDNKIKEKNIHILGSSIFYGNNGIGLAEHLYYIWKNPNIQKQAVSGTTIAVRSGYTNSYCERYENFADKDKCDVLVVQLSTNDWTLSVPDGTLSELTTEQLIADPSQLDNTTKTGAIEYIIAKAKANNPKVKVIFAACPMLSTWANFANYGTYVNGTLKQIAQKWGIKVCDMYNSTYDSYYKSHVSPERYLADCWSKVENGSYNLFRDDIHPNVQGYARVFVPAVASDIIEVLEEEDE